MGATTHTTTGPCGDFWIEKKDCELESLLMLFSNFDWARECAEWSVFLGFSADLFDLLNYMIFFFENARVLIVFCPDTTHILCISSIFHLYFFFLLPLRDCNGLVILVILCDLAVFY